MEIVKFLNLTKSTVYDITKRYHDALDSQEGPDEDKVVSSAKRPEATNQKGMPDFLQQLQGLVEDDGSSTMKHWVQEVTARVAYVEQQDSAPAHAANNSR